MKVRLELIVIKKLITEEIKQCAKRGKTPLFQSEEINKIVPWSNNKRLMPEFTDENKHTRCKNQ